MYVVYDIPSVQMISFVRKEVEKLESEYKKVAEAPQENKNEEMMQQATLERLKKELDVAKATFIFLSKMETVFGFMHDGDNLNWEYDLLKEATSKIG